MTHPIFSRIPILRDLADERFLDHRRRASSMAGFATLISAAVMFEYHILHDNFVSWDLLLVMATFAVFKIALFVWFRFRD